MDNLPIDIHSNKLSDWLISRRHCQKDWIKKIPAVREKIKHAILDMPENERILDLLKAGNINYFHCREIVDILKETEKDTKNIFGYYSSQRMKDWQEILDLYKKDNLFLIESGQLLQRLVHYDIPSMKKAVQKAELTIKESEKKERDCAKQSADAKKAYEKELHNFNIAGQHLKKELFELAKDLPAKFEELAKESSQFNAPIAYYDAFRDFVGIQQHTNEYLVALLRKLARKGADFTVYEWRNGKAPKEVQKIDFSAFEDKEVDDDEIDFGDDDVGTADIVDETEIDFGDDLKIEVIEDENGSKASSANDDHHENGGIAKFDNAFSIFEFSETFVQLVADLEELLTFLRFRIADEAAEDPAHVYIASYERRPVEIASVSTKQLEQWSKSIEAYLTKLRDPKMGHLAKIRTSPLYVEDLIVQLELKERQIHKYSHMGNLAAKKQAELTEQIQNTEAECEVQIDSARELQGQVEDEISKLYNGREVNIIGEIAEVLYA